MSLGYCGKCMLIDEDNGMAIYSYSGENWNDEGVSKSGDIKLQDGVIIINKCCLEEPEIHRKLLKMPSGKKRMIEKRIICSPSIAKHIHDGNIIIEKPCKNDFARDGYSSIKYYLAYHLLYKIFETYQKEGKLPDFEVFVQ